jgi:ribosomal protein S19E (S16A)
MASAKEAVVEADFIKQVKASLRKDASELSMEDRARSTSVSRSKETAEPSPEQRWFLQAASLSKGNTRPPVETRGLLVKAAYGGSYGVDEQFIKRACAEFTQRSQ